MHLLIFFPYSFSHSQDEDAIERPVKRNYGTSQSSSSSSPESSSSCNFSPQYTDIITSSDDEKHTTVIENSNYKSSTKKSSSEAAITTTGECSHQRDSQATTVVYSSSSKINQQKNAKTISIDIVSSPAESSSSVEGSDFDAVTNLDVDDLVSDYSVFSPLESESLQDERKLMINKNEKTPHSQKKRSLCYKTKLEDKVPCYVTPTSEQRICPLPLLKWADREAVWTNMVRKDEKASLSRDVNMFEQHPGLQPRMRAILLDWLIEVCEVYKLHRETYYLTVDYLDRYVTAKSSISKNQLQLIGITCLFIASKVRILFKDKNFYK